MRLEARYNGQTYLVEVLDPEDEGRAFELRIRIKDGSEKVESAQVSILSRRGREWTIDLDGRIEDFAVTGERGKAVVNYRQRLYPVEVDSLRDRVRHKVTELEATDTITLKAQMPGKVVKVLSSEGDVVESGQGLVVIEAMKMQNELRSPKSGTVVNCEVEEGGTVNTGQLLFRIE